MCIYMCIYIYIYIYIYRALRASPCALACPCVSLHVPIRGEEHTANPPTNVVDFRGFDSSLILIQRGGILMSIGKLPESLSQAMLVGTMLVGRLGVR